MNSYSELVECRRCGERMESDHYDNSDRSCPECGAGVGATRIAKEDEHPCQTQGIELDEGDKVLFNDRARSLKVIDRHKRQATSSTWKHRGESKYLDIIELEGNGTEYHLLCHSGSSIGPMLYKEADWDDDKTDKIGQSPKYSRMGERVESMEVVQ
jgi:ribosomal protein L37E